MNSQQIQNQIDRLIPKAETGDEITFALINGSLLRRLRCRQCQSVFREADAIGDLHCPECHGTQLWETAAKTDDQLADEQFAAEAEESSAELEAVARRRIEARGIADELVDVLRDVMGGVR